MSDEGAGGDDDDDVITVDEDDELFAAPVVKTSASSVSTSAKSSPVAARPKTTKRKLDVSSLSKIPKQKAKNINEELKKEPTQMDVLGGYLLQAQDKKIAATAVNDGVMGALKEQGVVLKEQGEVMKEQGEAMKRLIQAQEIRDEKQGMRDSEQSEINKGLYSLLKKMNEQ